MNLDLLASLKAKENARNDIVYGINRDPYLVAAKEGWTVVIPDNYTLQLGFDTDEQFKEFLHILRKIEKDTGFYFKPFEDNFSKSGAPHRHVTLKSKSRMSVWQRIALQFALGSDPVRERLNCERVLLCDPYPIAFFEKDTI